MDNAKEINGMDEAYCPCCHSTNTSRYDFDDDGDYFIEYMECLDCGRKYRIEYLLAPRYVSWDDETEEV